MTMYDLGTLPKIIDTDSRAFCQIVLYVRGQSDLGFTLRLLRHPA